MPPYRSKPSIHQARASTPSYISTSGRTSKDGNRNWKLTEDVVQPKVPPRKVVDGPTTRLQSLRRGQKSTAPTRWSPREEEDERGKVVSQTERLVGELENLRSALQREEESSKRAAEENRRLEEEVAQLRASQSRTVDEPIALSQSLERERVDEAAMRRPRRRGEDEIGRTFSQNQQVTGELGSLRHQLEGKDAELNNIRRKLQQWQTKHDELSTLLETRSRELKGAQVYLTKADTLSGAEVIALVDALNAEILQASAFISDSFDFARKPAFAAERTVATTKITEFIGSTLAHQISAISHSDDAFLVQIALQSAMVELSHRIVTTWDLDDLQAEQPLAQLYNNIRATGQVHPLNRITPTDDRTETQAVGGRWRALTRAHALRAALQEGNPHATTAARISDTLVAVLVAAGCTKNHRQTHRIFTQNFGERTSDIVRLALRLNKAMGEEVTSADLRPVSVTSGEMFDGATMANFESRGEDSNGQVVLCTTALGMQRSERVVRGDVVEFKTTILLKPKVAVESVIDAMNGDDTKDWAML